jgi:hypothetical protein
MKLHFSSEQKRKNMMNKKNNIVVERQEHRERELTILPSILRSNFVHNTDQQETTETDFFLKFPLE